ncbi:MAG: sulfatase-like hydrolase/transferase [Planctomycetota bacterium]|nr:sulfatase-like hydrolase/transferase [Planctomycetota bacterium]
MRSVLVLLAIAALATKAAAEPPPGIRGVVFILADDHRADFLGCAGRTGLATPAIDALARRGVRFTHAYCEGSRSPAVCLPSRSRMLCGLSDWTVPDWSTAHRGDDHPLWPEVLRSEGWRTHHVGKWHAGRPWFDRCFESGASVLFGGMGSHWDLVVEDRPLAEGAVTRRPLRDYSTTEFGGAAVEFLAGHLAAEPDRPFALSLCFTAPHDPRTAPDEAEADRRAATVAVPPNLMPVHPFDNGEMTIRDEELLPWPRTERAVRREIAVYEQMIEEIDRQVATVVDVLDDAGVLEETLVIFAGDHGLAIGSHGLLGKQNLYEHSMRSPLVLAGPGFERPGERRDLAYLRDIPTTILGVASTSPPPDMDGLDLRGPTMRREILTRYKDEQRAWTDGRWKVIWHPPIDRWQVFDLDRDPDELHDLAADPDARELVRRLVAELVAARVRHGDEKAFEPDPNRSPSFDHEAASRRRAERKPHWELR